MAKILAIDYGSKKIGLAIGDTKEYYIAPLEIISTGSFNDYIKDLTKVILENKIEEIVVGYPLNMKGKKTEQTEEVEEFAEKLKDEVEVPIILEDERLTTAQAKNQQKGFLKKIWSGGPKDNLQKTAAILILETYIEKKKELEP